MDPTGFFPTQYNVDAGFYPSSAKVLAHYAQGCSYVAGAPPDPKTTSNAGTIALTDGQMDLGNLAYNSVTGYSPNAGAASSWNPGDSLTANASGDLVGAFKGSTTAPANLQTVQLGGKDIGASTLTVSVGSASTVTWNGGAAALVHVELSATNSASNTVGTIYCNGSDATGTMSIPANLIKNFSAGQTGSLIIQRINYAQVSASNATVYVAAINDEYANVTYGP
jgi:hypothetical protein